MTSQFNRTKTFGLRKDSSGDPIEAKRARPLTGKQRSAWVAAAEDRTRAVSAVHGKRIVFRGNEASAKMLTTMTSERQQIGKEKSTATGTLTSKQFQLQGKNAVATGPPTFSANVTSPQSASIKHRFRNGITDEGSTMKGASSMAGTKQDWLPPARNSNAVNTKDKVKRLNKGNFRLNFSQD